MPFIGDIHHSSYLSGSNQQPLLAERRRPGLSSAMSSGVPGRHFQWNLKGFQTFNRSKSLLPQEAWRMGIMGTGRHYLMISLWFLCQRSQIISSMVSPKSHKKPLQRLQRSLPAFHELSLKMEHSLGLTLRGDLSSMDTSGIGMTIVTMAHAPRHPTWAQLSSKAQALSYDFIAAALSYSRNLRFLMPTFVYGLASIWRTNMDSLWYTLACIFLAAAETAAPATEPPVIGGGSERLTSSGQEPPERHAARRPAGVAGIWAGFFQMESVLMGRNRKDEQATKSRRSQCIDINNNST